MNGARVMRTSRLSSARPRATGRDARPSRSLAMRMVVGTLFVAVASNEPRASAQPAPAPPGRVDHARQGLAKLSVLRPYERGKIPVVLVHGLWGSERQWDRMVRDLEVDEAIRSRYQFWTFGYATGDSIPSSALRLRRAIRRAREAFDPGGTDAAFDRMVVVGHSLGGLLAKMTAQTTGPNLWRTVSTKHPDEMSGPAEDVRLLREAFIYERLPEVRRLIFIATPHRGSSLARGVLRDLGTHICRVTGGTGDVCGRLLGCNDAGFFEPGFRLNAPTSVGELEPGSPLITALGELGVDPAVIFHSIIPSRGPETGDGIVPLASAHLEGAESELRVRAGHACLEEGEVIRETARILAKHVSTSDKDLSSHALDATERRSESWDVHRSSPIRDERTRPGPAPSAPKLDTGRPRPVGVSPDANGGRK
jgi:pimeloyl-ACP methyl ester carboxylesterase